MMRRFGLTVFHADFLDDAVGFGFDFVQKLHGFDDADGLTLLDGVAHFNEGLGARRRSAVEGADHRARKGRAFDLGFGGFGRGGLGGRSGSRGGRRNGDGRGSGRLHDLNGRLRMIDHANAVRAFANFKFGNAAFGHEVQQGLNFAQIHLY